MWAEGFPACIPQKIKKNEALAVDILKNEQILRMYEEINVSIAVIDRDLKMIYCNPAAQKFYSKLFGERDYLGYSTRNCHSQTHQKNIDALFLMFAMGKPMNFYHAKFPGVEGGEATVMQFPYTVNGRIEGIMEVCIESSLAPGGRGEHRRVFEET